MSSSLLYSLGISRSQSQNGADLDPELQKPLSARGQRLAQIAHSLRVVRDIPFANRSQRTLRLDVYAPAKKHRKPLPAILRFGVAAWRSGTKDFRIDLDQLLAAPTPNLFAPVMVPQGFVVVSAECRVASEARFPAQVHDCKCAVRWIRAHAKEFGIDPERVGIMGASASGHLAALVAVTGPNDALEDDSCYSEYSSRVQAAYCFAGMYDFEFYEANRGDGTLWPQINDFLGETFQKDPDVYRRASPKNYVTRDDPPFLLIHGIQDGRVPYNQTPRFAESLQGAGVPVDFVSINNYRHGPIPGKESEPGYAVLDDRIFQFFRRSLG